MTSIIQLKQDISECSSCSNVLPFDPRPVVQFDAASKILIAGHAPGKRVHDSGVPFDDASGKRLREWLGVSNTEFYNSINFAILPMGFCYPGKGQSGDLPPRPECAEKWRLKVLSKLKEVQLVIVLGQHAIKYHLPNEKGNLTNTVQNWQAYWPNTIALPHPSPRNNIWLKRNPWFEADVLPILKQRIIRILNT